MADKSSIEWTEATWNPVTGCTKVSPGCDHCYAERIVERFKGKGAFENVTLNQERLDAPLRWRKPRRVFVNSMSDLFHDEVPDEFIATVFAVMALTHRHTYQVLTKRHGRTRSLLNQPDFREAVAEHVTDLLGTRAWQCWQVDLGGQRLAGDSGLGGGWTTTPSPAGNLWSPPWPLPNVWLGVSVEDQRWADIRIPALLDTQAAVRFLSCEPLLRSVNLWQWLDPADPDTDCDQCGEERFADEIGVGHDRLIYDERGENVVNEVWCDGPSKGMRPRRIDWVIAGGESGPGARPMRPEWARLLRDQCTEAYVPFFFKQVGGHTPKAGRELDGRTWDEYPEVPRAT